MIHLKVKQDFIQHRTDKFALYNQRGRTDKRFLMDIDAELYEFEMISSGVWQPHESWMVDGIDLQGRNVDVKFVQKYWNLSGSKITNILQQRKILDGYKFMQWVNRPARPLEAGDEVFVKDLGFLPYDTVADGIRPSFKAQGQYYFDVHKAL